MNCWSKISFIHKKYCNYKFLLDGFAIKHNIALIILPWYFFLVRAWSFPLISNSVKHNANLISSSNLPRSFFYRLPGLNVGTGKAVCLTCNMELSCNDGSTTSMRYHLRHKHRVHFWPHPWNSKQCFKVHLNVLNCKIMNCFNLGSLPNDERDGRPEEIFISSSLILPDSEIVQWRRSSAKSSLGFLELEVSQTFPYLGHFFARCQFH